MSTVRFLAPALGAVVCTGLGLACGWFITRGDGAAGQNAAPHSGAGSAPDISPLALENLGVELAPAEATTYSVHRTVTAEVALPPEALRPVYAPTAGTITRIAVREASNVPAGAELITLARDPLPALRLDLTAEVLRPAQETRHEALVALRKSASELAIAQEEYERVRTFTEGSNGDGLPIVPRSRSIELRYELRRAEIANEHARHELLRHGLSKTEIDHALTVGHLPAFDGSSWRRALDNNGLWPASADDLLSALPETQQTSPWIVATVGELAARGKIDADLLAWVRSHKEAAAPYFDSIGAMLLNGAGLAAIDRLVAQGALAPKVSIAAPDVGPAGWIVDHLDIRAPGAHVGSGERLATLRDSSRVRLRCSPVGDEVAAVERAIANGTACVALPLLRGDGPRLTDVKFTALRGSELDHKHAVAFADVDNSLLSNDGQPAPAASTWSLRPGQHYAIEVPYDVVEDVIVLPIDALVSEDTMSIVFIYRRDHFDPLEVRVLHRDAHSVVIPSSGPGSLRPGTQVVIHGALALQFALRGPNDDAGHGHSHGI